MENQRTIYDLPIEVLDLIFVELQSLVDKVQLAQVHEKLGKAFAYHSRSAFKKLSPFFGVTQELWLFIVSLCGSTVEEFSSRQIWNTPWSDILVESIEQHCTNLKSVRIDVFENNCDGVRSFLLKMSKLLVSAELTIFTKDPKKLFDSVAEMANVTQLALRGNITEDGKLNILVIAQFKYKNIINLFNTFPYIHLYPKKFLNNQYTRFLFSLPDSEVNCSGGTSDRL